jgi:hypothetical protein
VWRRLILCLLLGAMTTVAVAWSLAAWVDMSRAKASSYYSPNVASLPDPGSTVSWGCERRDLCKKTCASRHVCLCGPAGTGMPRSLAREAYCQGCGGRGCDVDGDSG